MLAILASKKNMLIVFCFFFGFIAALRIVIVVVLLVGAAVLTFFGIVCCLRATQRASRALALPIPLLPDDQTPLNAEPEHPVPVSLFLFLS